MNRAAIRERFLTPGRAAAFLHTTPQTVGRWADEGQIKCIRTLGGHRRYPESEVRAFLARWRAR